MTAQPKPPFWAVQLDKKLDLILAELKQVAVSRQHVVDDGRLRGQYDAIELFANMMDGKVYWSVKGGKYSRHGASIWPEVMKPAGFDPDVMDITKKVDLSGWVAHYTCEEDGSKPKVVKLEPPTSASATSPQMTAKRPSTIPTDTITQRPKPTTQQKLPSSRASSETDWKHQAETAVDPLMFDTAIVRLEPWFKDSATAASFFRLMFGGEYKPEHATGYTVGMISYAQHRIKANGAKSAHDEAKVRGINAYRNAMGIMQ